MSHQKGRKWVPRFRMEIPQRGQKGLHGMRRRQEGKKLLDLRRLWSDRVKVDLYDMVPLPPVRSRWNPGLQECYRAQAVRRIAGRARGRLREYRRQVRRRAIMEEVWKEIGAMVRARSRQPQHREADIPSHSHPQTVTSIKEFQPKDVSRSQTADNCKRRRKDGREIRSNEVRREVAAQARSRRTPSATPANMEPRPTRARRDSSPTSNPDAVLLDGQSIEKPTKNSASLHAYECPFCHMTVHSSLETGNVHVSGHCGKQFRVRDGEVTRAFTHACPKCGTAVSSTIARGKLGVSHRLPNGRPCPITRWTVK